MARRVVGAGTVVGAARHPRRRRSCLSSRSRDRPDAKTRSGSPRADRIAAPPPNAFHDRIAGIHPGPRNLAARARPSGSAAAMSLAGFRRHVGWVSPLVLIAVIVAVWQIAVRASDTPLWLLPAPSDVVQSLVEDRDILLPNALVTLSEVLIGFACAVVAGVGLGVAVYRSPTLNRALYPIIISSQTIPIPALAPLLLVLFGYGLGPKVIVTALV